MRINQAIRAERSDLDLAGLQLTRLPKEVCAFTTLRHLNLSFNRLETLPPEIADLTDLTRLNLTENKIIDLPSEISRLTALRWLSISKNNLVNPPDEIFRLTGLETLELDGNEIKTIPANVGALVALQWLDLGRNRLTFLPVEIGKLSALVYLNLSYNQLENLPPEIGPLTALRNLTIDSNRLSSIPELIGRLVGLRSLSARDNQITFVSPEIGRLAALTTLNLSNNRLTVLPEEVGLLHSLEQLNVCYNRLTALPRNIGRLRKLESSREGILFEGNPLPYPYPALTWAGQPGTTYNVLAWLRGELDDQYPPNGGQGQLTDPPVLPPQTVRPFVEIGNHGEINFVPAEVLDAEGNNLPQLRRLHPALVSIAQDLCSALPTGNSQHPALERRCACYRELIDRPLDELDFGKLYLEGIRLEHARQRDDVEVADQVLAQLPAEADEALKSLLRAHASFILATTAGIEAIAAEVAYDATPNERRIARAEERTLARSLTQAPNISAEVREALEQTAEENFDGKEGQRTNVAEIAFLRNVTAAAIASAAIASPALVGFLVFGPAGTIIGGAAALPILESLKKTKTFARASGYLSGRIDRITEEEAQQFLLRVREGRAAVQRLERAFWRVAGRKGFEWLGAWLEWLSGRKSDDQKDDR